MQRRDMVFAVTAFSAMSIPGAVWPDGPDQNRPGPRRPAAKCPPRNTLSAAEKRAQKRARARLKNQIVGMNIQINGADQSARDLDKAAKEDIRVAERLTETRAQNERDRKAASKRVADIDRALRRGKTAAGKPLSEPIRAALKGERASQKTKADSLKAFDSDLRKQARKERDDARKARNAAEEARERAKKLRAERKKLTDKYDKACR